MTEIQQFKKYKARIKYHRTDDLQPDALPDGMELIVWAMWMADDGEKFAGEWIFEPEDRGLWLPECDLEIMGEVFDGWIPNDLAPGARVISREELSITELADLVCKLYRPIFDRKKRK